MTGSMSFGAAANFAASLLSTRCRWLTNQTLDSWWFRVLAFIGTVAFALSGVVLAAVLTASFGGLMRDLLRHDRVAANLGGELYRRDRRRLGPCACVVSGMGERAARP